VRPQDKLRDLLKLKGFPAIAHESLPHWGFQLMEDGNYWSPGHYQAVKMFVSFEHGNYVLSQQSSMGGTRLVLKESISIHSILVMIKEMEPYYRDCLKLKVRTPNE
jgi:hypothetical protein